MRIIKLAWVGTEPTTQNRRLAFFHEVLGLRLQLDRPAFWMLKLPDGSKVEVFGPDSAINRHFTTDPVAGFLVDDVQGATAELRSAGVEILYESGVDASGNPLGALPRPGRKYLRVHPRPWRLSTALRPMATAGVVVDCHRRSREPPGQAVHLRLDRVLDGLGVAAGDHPASRPPSSPRC